MVAFEHSAKIFAGTVLNNCAFQKNGTVIKISTFSHTNAALIALHSLTARTTVFTALGLLI